MKRKDNPSRQVAIDLVLRTFMNTSGFNEMEPKNWDAISRLIPGSTPQECMHRFEALKRTAKSLAFTHSALSAEGKSALTTAPRTGSARNSLRLSEGGDQGVPKGSAGMVNQVSDRPTKKEQVKQSHKMKFTNHSEKSTNMVIHVCDEAKNVKKDFTCPRDLLVVEMKYFAEYLSSDGQQWEDVDISVHCDVQIFEWLMSYVKRNLPGFSSSITPTLEASNVISILISSDFLKMDGLVEDCIKYCHQNMTEIIATPCNMNCINDKLCTRIAALFTDIEVDGIKDKKDKFKSKLFTKKIESLLGKKGPAATLFRCQFCRRLLTNDTMKVIRCLPNRASISREGTRVYYHRKDGGWDVNDHLLRLKKELKSWGNVYWRLWGSGNCLRCTHCKQVFPCCEFRSCWVHPEKPNFLHPGLKTLPTGTYGCCKRKALRFDYLTDNGGCQVRDHVIDVPGDSPSESQMRDSEVYAILGEKVDVICTPTEQSPDLSKSPAVNIFSGDESLVSSTEDHLVLNRLGFLKVNTDQNNEAEVRDFTPDNSDSSDDEVGDDEISKTAGKARSSHSSKSRTQKKSTKQALSSASSYSVTSLKSYSHHKWDVHRSLRSNQDSQREEDRLRMDELNQRLLKQRNDSYSNTQEKTKRREYSGGLFSRLESQFKASLNVSRPNPMSVQLRSKVRIGQVRAT